MRLWSQRFNRSTPVKNFWPKASERCEQSFFCWKNVVTITQIGLWCLVSLASAVALDKVVRVIGLLDCNSQISTLRKSQSTLMIKMKLGRIGYVPRIFWYTKKQLQSAVRWRLHTYIKYIGVMLYYVSIQCLRHAHSPNGTPQKDAKWLKQTRKNLRICF
jgi:hypothetical protein